MTYLYCSLAFALGWVICIAIAESRTGSRLTTVTRERDGARRALTETSVALENCRADMNDFAERAAHWERIAVQAQAELANRIARASERGRKAAATRKARAMGVYSTTEVANG
jgi:hypothetical protein